MVISSSQPAQQLVGDSNQVYQDYLSYCNIIDAAIQTLQGELVQLPPGSAQYQQIENNIAGLQNLKNGTFYQAYQADYATGNSTDFENQWNAPGTGFLAQVNSYLNLSPDAQKIAADYAAAQQALQSILSELSQALSHYNSLQSQISQWESTIQGLEGKVSGNAQAQKDLATAQSMLASLQSQVSQLGGDIATLQQAQTQFTSELNQLQALSQISNPTDQDAAQADALLSSIQGQLQGPSFNQITQALQDLSTNSPSVLEIEAMNHAILQVQQDIGPVGQTAYIDIMSMGGMSQASINTIIAELQAGKINQIDLSFAQITDLTTWEAGDAGGNTTFQQVIQAAHAEGIKVDLSFGGSVASLADWEIANGTSSQKPTPAQQLATQLATFAQQYGIDGLDFDYEVDLPPSPPPGSTAPNYPQNLLSFFETLHTQMSPLHIPMTLTVMGSPSNSVGSPDGSGGYSGGSINNLFQNFSQCFDGLNLMLYGGPEYLTGSPNYLQMWIGNKGENNGVASQYGIPLNEIHVGFMNYNNGGPGGYPGSGTDGANAADDYLSALSALGYSPSDLGSTFWWPWESGKGYMGDIAALEQELGYFNTALQG